MKAGCFVLLACVLVFAPLGQAQRTGVINDPDGFVNDGSGPERRPGYGVNQVPRLSSSR
jgi:hypothetical protein